MDRKITRNLTKRTQGEPFKERFPLTPLNLSKGTEYKQEFSEVNIITNKSRHPLSVILEGAVATATEGSGHGR